jgi:hypothetical protein
VIDALEGERIMVFLMKKTLFAALPLEVQSAAKLMVN